MGLIEAWGATPLSSSTSRGQATERMCVFGRLRPRCWRFGAKVHRVRIKLGRIWPTSAPHRPNSARTRPISGQVWSSSVQHRSSSRAKVGRSRAEIGRPMFTPPKSAGPRLVDVCAQFGRSRPKPAPVLVLGRCLSKLPQGGFGPNSTERGRFRPASVSTSLRGFGSVSASVCSLDFRTPQDWEGVRVGSLGAKLWSWLRFADSSALAAGRVDELLACFLRSYSLAGGPLLELSSARPLPAAPPGSMPASAGDSRAHRSGLGQIDQGTSTQKHPNRARTLSLTVP